MKKQKKFSGLRKRIILPTLVVIVSGFTLILVTIISRFSYTANKLSEDKMLEMGQHYSNLIGRELDSSIIEARNLVTVLEESRKAESMNRAEVMDFLNTILHQNDSILAIYTCWEPNAFDYKDDEYVNKYWHGKTGRLAPYLYWNEKKLSIETMENFDKDILDSYYSVPKLTLNEYIREPYIMKRDGKDYFVTSIVEPLCAYGRFVGIVGLDVLIDPMAEMLNKLEIFDNGYAYLISSEGQVITNPSEALIGKSLYDYMPDNTSDIVKKSLKKGSIEYFTHDINNSNSATRNIIVPIVMRDTEINWGIIISVPEDDLAKPITQGIIFGATIAIIVSAITLFILFGVINKVINKIYSINEGLSDSSSYVLSTSTQLATTSQEIADGSSEQAASVEETSATMEEVASMVMQNAGNTKIASSLSQEAKEASAIGFEKMNEMIKSMEELKKSSAQISKIIKVIDEIAFQTNILSLNAAVEAARAGEAGRGFAVVAEEVRNLARNSADAVKETTEIIEKNIKLSSQGVYISNEVKDSLQKITLKVEKVTGFVAEIASASDEQTKGVQQVNDTMENMEMAVQNNAAAAEEGAAVAEELQTYSKKLEEIVKQLNDLVYGNNELINFDKLKEKVKIDSKKNEKIDNKEEVTEELSTVFDSKQVISEKTKGILAEEIIPLEEDNDF